MAPVTIDLAREYDDWHQRAFDSAPEHADQNSPWYQLVLEYLGPVSGKLVLELSCGRGGFSTALASKGAVVCAADFAGSALRIARKKALKVGTTTGKVLLTQTDAHHLPFADGAFDVVISCETIEHLLEPPQAVKEMARVCKKEGRLYLTTPNYLNLMGAYHIYDLLLKRHRQSPAVQPIDHYWLFPQVRSMVEKAGWKILRADGTVHQVPFPGRNPIRLISLERSPAIRRWLCPLAYHYLLIGRKR
ncbi:MAG TPA: class I SAM-dependent methyltransferase [Terriglobia bacterium]|nr:class I SAM-dependent methyltransferase [Terriglobia bacterium]